MLRDAGKDRRQKAEDIIMETAVSSGERMMIPMKKNDEVELEITDITDEGFGVGRVRDGSGTGGYVVFVPGAAPGDVAAVRILKAGRSFGYGRVTSLLRASDLRTDPACPVFGRCGGCALRHITYEAELQLKKKWIADSLRRCGGTDAGDFPIYSAGPERYRNKAEYPAGTGPDGRLFFGLYAPRSHRTVDVGDCLLEPEFYGDIAAAAAGFCNRRGLTAYADGTGGTVRHLYIRDARATGEVSVSLIVSSPSLPFADEFADAVTAVCPQAVSVSCIVNDRPGNVILGDRLTVIRGRDTLTDVLCGVEFRISPMSFYQVNHDGAELLYRTAGDFAEAKAGDTVLDLYCGAGTVGLCVAPPGTRLIGVDIVPESIENARENAALAHRTDAEFFCADAGSAAMRLAGEGIRPDTVIVDPPRRGCGEEVFEAAKAMSPEKIVMISCNHVTCARDISRFAEIGYSVRRLAAVDMFPRTAHVETVVLMTRV